MCYKLLLLLLLECFILPYYYCNHSILKSGHQIFALFPEFFKVHILLQLIYYYYLHFTHNNFALEYFKTIECTETRIL